MSKLNIGKTAIGGNTVEVKMTNITISEGRPQLDKTTKEPTGKYWTQVLLTGGQLPFLWEDHLEQQATFDEVIFAAEARTFRGDTSLALTGVKEIRQAGKKVYPNDALK